jgi:hypothetical protein
MAAESGHKKTGLGELLKAGITRVPGLFSDLFYVAASRPAQITTGQVMLIFAAALPVKAAIG